MKYGLIGKTLGHSFSPELHRMLGGYDYDLKELRETELEAFFSRREFDGVNVTIPYKQAVFPYLDEIEPAAAAIGTVNTVVNRQGRLIGFNTDLDGMLALIRRMDLNFSGKKVLILGTGGTAKTAQAAAERLGASEIITVSRSGHCGAPTYTEAVSHHTDADFIINATPVGMYPVTNGLPIPVSAFPRLRGVVDAVYNPLRSRLVLDAQQRGIPAEGGLYMLAAQAALSSELFTGRPVPVETVDRAFASLLCQKRNLVLIGMPGSGKTTVGREAARRLGRRFLDLDEMIRQRAGKTIPEIFERDGESAFRDLETEIVGELAGFGGNVIATGGGTVLRRENVERLRQNGKIILLDRPRDQLQPTGDRPLADTAQKMDELYRARMDLYRAAAEQIIPTGTDAIQTADAVIRCFNEV